MGKFIEEFYYGNLDPQARSTRENKTVQKQMEVLMLNEEFLTEIVDAEVEIADAEAEIADIEKPETYVLGRETNVGYVCFENDSAIVDGIANEYPT